MEPTQATVESHYAREGLYYSIVAALRGSGKDIARLTPADLAPVDEFHVRGRAATVELASSLAPQRGLRVLDVGCGLGGSARYFASEYGCRVTGIDLTAEYVEVASALAKLVGLEGQVDFRHASALQMPFGDGAFDLVWTEHVQMNIAAKRAFYAEIARVLAPGGRFAFHDVFQGEGELHFPVPWAEDPAINFLAPPGEVRSMLQDLGLTIQVWEDKSLDSLQWLAGAIEKTRQPGRPGLGLHLLMGENARSKSDNVMRNLREGRMVVVQAIAQKS
jgi:MPBQ/MSBQ methyltransferase